jgi:fatty acyl-CoA reductase
MAQKLNSVQEFYKGKSIFVTGGSGFMGKVLIEKLLYSCSELKEIIILMRPKRGKSANQRVEDLSKLPVSEIIKNSKN